MKHIKENEVWYMCDKKRARAEGKYVGHTCAQSVSSVTHCWSGTVVSRR